MAEGTRYARLEETLSKLVTFQESQALSIDTINSSIKELAVGLQTLEGKVEQQMRRSTSSSAQNPPISGAPNFPTPASSHTLPAFAKSMRVDMPRFSGDNPSAWVSRVQRYFDYYNTPDTQRLLVASFHLDGAALDWFDWMSRNSLIQGWAEFIVAITKRFGPSEYEDHFGRLSKLTQLGSLTDYQHQFEQLANNIVNVPEHVLISCFVSGLRHDLERRLKFIDHNRSFKQWDWPNCTLINSRIVLFIRLP